MRETVSETVGWLQGHLCSSLDVTEALCGRGLPRLLDTVECLCQFEIKERRTPSTAPTLQDTTVSLLLLALFVTTVVLLALFPPPD